MAVTEGTFKLPPEKSPLASGITNTDSLLAPSSPVADQRNTANTVVVIDEK